jgi:hypothetical protein
LFFFKVGSARRRDVPARVTVLTFTVIVLTFSIMKSTVTRKEMPALRTAIGMKTGDSHGSRNPAFLA